MNKADILKETQQIFQMVFMDSSLQINLDTKAEDIDLWDSLSHIELITAIENKFNIHISFREVMNFQYVGDMIDSIEKHLQL